MAPPMASSAPDVTLITSSPRKSKRKVAEPLGAPPSPTGTPPPPKQGRGVERDSSNGVALDGDGDLNVERAKSGREAGPLAAGAEGDGAARNGRSRLVDTLLSPLYTLFSRSKGRAGDKGNRDLSANASGDSDTTTVPKAAGGGHLVAGREDSKGKSVGSRPPLLDVGTETLGANERLDDSAEEDAGTAAPAAAPGKGGAGASELVHSSGGHGHGHGHGHKDKEKKEDKDCPGGKGPAAKDGVKRVSGKAAAPGGAVATAAVPLVGAPVVVNDSTAAARSPEEVKHVIEAALAEEPEAEAVDDEAFDPFLFIKNLPPLEQCVPAGRGALLPKQTRSTGHRKTLVLDLDETLVHACVDLEGLADFVPDFSFPVSFNRQTHMINVKQRPHLKSFMERVADMFEVVIFTASQKVYAERLLNILDPSRRLIRHRLFRDSCVVVDGNYIKDLSVLGRDLAHTIIVDNSPQAFGFQVENGIPIESWYDDPSDSELLGLLPFLAAIAKADVADVRPAIRDKFRLHDRISAAK